MKLQMHLNPGKHCLYSSLYNIFSYKKIGIKEYELFFLCNGLDFRFENNEAGLLEQIAVDYRYQIQQLCKHTSITATIVNNFNSDKECFGYIKKKQTQLPALLFLNPGVLKYHILEAPQENLGSHGLILHGYDISKKLIYISDTYILDYENEVGAQQSELTCQKLLDYLIGICFFDCSEYQPVESRVVHEVLIQNLAAFYHEDKNTVFGNTALHNILNGILELVDMEPQECVKSVIEIIYLIKAYFFTTIEYLRDYLMDNKPIHEKKTNDMIKELDELHDQWKHFFIRCLCVITGNDKALLKKIVNSGHEALAQQKSVYMHLIDYVQTLVLPSVY